MLKKNKEFDGQLNFLGYGYQNFRGQFEFSLLITLVAQMVKSLPVRRETQVRTLGWEDPLKKEMTTHSSILARKIPRTVLGIAKSRT